MNNIEPIEWFSVTYFVITGIFFAVGFLGGLVFPYLFAFNSK